MTLQEESAWLTAEMRKMLRDRIIYLLRTGVTSGQAAAIVWDALSNCVTMFKRGTL